MALLAVTTAAYAFLLGPALRFLLAGGEGGLPVLGVDRARALWLLPALVLGIGVLKGLAYLGQFFWMGLYGQHVTASLRTQLFRRLGTWSPTQLHAERAGDLLGRFTADVASVEQAATYGLAAFARDGMQLVALGAVAAWAGGPLALPLVALTAVVLVPASRFTRSL